LKITDFLESDLIIPNLHGRDKTTVMREMAECLCSHDPRLDLDSLLGVLLERERIGSTAIGEGVAIPHGKMPGTERVRGIFARSLEGVDFASIDGGLTYLLFLLVAPENSAGDHLKALARISRLLKDSAFRADLLKAKSKEELFKMIQEEDDKL
jgi:PTS system nitrogen regulatory IIA component